MVEDDRDQGLDVLDPDSLEVELGDYRIGCAEPGTRASGQRLVG